MLGCVYINTYGVTSWGRARVECTPLQSRHGACHDSTPHFLQSQTLARSPGEFGTHQWGSAPSSGPWCTPMGCEARPEFPLQEMVTVNSVDLWPLLHWLQHLWSTSCVFGFCFASGTCGLHSGTECDSIPWFASECSGNFPNLVCSNELAFTLCCMLIRRDPSETGKEFFHFRKIRKI